ncbi:hypothetical protein [Flexithrix dorotheae]|uniref:hypothetical protein n=1 Tax=Flexithrix dorotheae TaxID=70993 RepID=UPI00037763D8|nr:hypothetical protein [Flexithrix dorotheae]
MKKSLTIFLIIIAIQIPISCDRCGGGEPFEGKISNLESSIGTFESERFVSKENSDFDKAAIQVEIADLKFSHNSFFLKRFTNPFASQVYACSPPPPITTQKIKEIIISSSKPLFSGGGVFVEGSNLNELFKVSNHDNSSINEFINDQNEDKYLFGYLGSKIILTLLEKPDSSVNQNFQIKFEFTDLETIEIETGAFKVI